MGNKEKTMMKRIIVIDEINKRGKIKVGNINIKGKTKQYKTKRFYANGILKL